MFYICQNLLRFVVTMVITLAALCLMVYVMESADCRLMLYIFGGWMAAIFIEEKLFGRGREDDE